MRRRLTTVVLLLLALALGLAWWIQRAPAPGEERVVRVPTERTDPVQPREAKSLRSVAAEPAETSVPKPVPRGADLSRVAFPLPDGGSARLATDRARVGVAQGFHVTLRLARADGTPSPGRQPYVLVRHSGTGESWNSALFETVPGSGEYQAPFFADDRTREPGTLTVSLLPDASGDPSLPRTLGPAIRIQIGAVDSLPIAVEAAEVSTTAESASPP